MHPQLPTWRVEHKLLMYSRSSLHRSFYIDVAFWVRRHMRVLDTCASSIFCGAPTPHDPCPPSTLIPHHVTGMLRQILSCEPAPPILKGASPLLHRWASSVGTVRDISDCARATYKDQPGRRWPPPRKYPLGRGLGNRGRARCDFRGRSFVRDTSAGC